MEYITLFIEEEKMVAKVESNRQSVILRGQSVVKLLKASTILAELLESITHKPQIEEEKCEKLLFV